MKLRDFIDDGVCTQIGADLFFGDPNDGPTAKRVCKTMCEVQSECLTYALETNQPSGIWGGTDVHEREKIKRDRR